MTNGLSPRPRRLGRSLWALLAGFLVVVILSIGTDLLLHATSVFPPWGQRMSDALFLLATGYRTVYGVLGSYITARVAPDRPMQHALVGCAVGLVLATAGAVATWNNGPEFGPHWYPLSLLATALPSAWMGGWLRVRELGARSAPAAERYERSRRESGDSES